MQFAQGVKETVLRTVPAGGVLADTAYLIGVEILVATDDYDAADTGVFVKRGLVGLKPKAGDVPVDGGACYLDATTHEVQATPGAAVYLCGARNSKDAVSFDDGTTFIGVDLDGTVAAVYGVPGDIQGVTAGTGLTGGGTSGPVTLSIDSSAIPGMAAVGGAGNLVQTAAADRALSDASIPVANVVTEAAAASAADQIVTSAGASKVVKDSGVPLANLPQMAAVGGVGELLYTVAADRAVSSSGLAVGMLPRIARVRVTAPADGNAHDTALVLPAKALVLDAWIDVVTADTVPGSTTFSFGVNGTTTGFVTGLDLTSTGIATGGVDLDGTNNWFTATTYGSLLADFVAGTNADDRGLYARKIKDKGGETVAYQASAGSNAVIDLYVMYAVPQ